MIVIGSQALRHELSKLGQSLPTRDRSDLDIIAHGHEVPALLEDLTVIKRSGSLLSGMKILAQRQPGRQGSPFIEIEVPSLGSSSHYYLMYAEMFTTLDKGEFLGRWMDIANLEILYSLQRSHRHSPRLFWKHVYDYNLLRKLLNGKDALEKITKLRYQETVERQKLRTPSLKKSVVEFFNDKVSNRTFVHDEIHAVMAHLDEPLFEKIRENKESVKCSKEKWEQLPFEQKRMCVQEEAYVIALERGVIPMLFEGGPIVSPRRAYEWAVMRICTTLCSGWFREWALENVSNILVGYDPCYVNRFLSAVEDGRIKRIEK